MAFNAIVQNDRELPGSFGCGLSEAAASVWAKHDRSTDEWMPLWRHLADAGAVAGLLWDRWLPSQVKQVIVESLPGGLEDGGWLAVWLAATHDIEKATPAFACQVESLADVMRSAGLDMPLAGGHLGVPPSYENTR